MIINRLLKILLVILGVVYIALNVLKVNFYADLLSVVVLVLFTTLYIRQAKALIKKKPFFLLFLLAFTISHFLQFIFYLVDNSPTFDVWIYYFSNFFSMLAYVFLTLRCLVTMKFTRIVKNFPVTILILIVLGVFCVTLITETAQTKLSTYEYASEMIYNAIVMTLLSISLINYMDKSDNKSMLFFVACMFIFFSEMLQLAYFYVEELAQLVVMYSIFQVLAFVFYYHQSRLKHEKQSSLNFIDSK